VVFKSVRLIVLLMTFFLFVAFVELLGTVYAFFGLWILFCCLCLCVGTC
jgi:hypothetical protein